MMWRERGPPAPRLPASSGRMQEIATVPEEIWEEPLD